MPIIPYAFDFELTDLSQKSNLLPEAFQQTYRQLRVLDWTLQGRCFRRERMQSLAKALCQELEAQGAHL